MHDLGRLLRGDQEKFPPSFRRQIERLAAILRWLRMERELSFYGDEETGVSPQELYGREDASGFTSKKRAMSWINAWHFPKPASGSEAYSGD